MGVIYISVRCCRMAFEDDFFVDFQIYSVIECFCIWEKFNKQTA